jgi:hypothetical protein
MRRRTIVFIACSPHARTGVSTTARLLTDYYLSLQMQVRGFDTDPHEPFYADLFPEYVHSIDVNDIRGQIALFDSLLADDDAPKIVDVWYRSYDKFFSTIKEIHFMEEAVKVGLEPIFLYHVDPTERSLAGALALQATWRDIGMITVHNEGASPLGAEAHEILSLYPARGKFVIGALDAPVARAIQNANFSLTRFLSAPPSDMSIVVRAALRSWTLSIFTQFQSFELRAALERSDCLR